MADLVLGTGVLGTDTLGASLQVSQPWRVRITLNGVDISAQVVDEFSVDAEERTARQAKFMYYPNLAMDGSVIIDPDDWLGQSVKIEYDNGQTGFLSIFVGKVNLAEYDPITRLATINASDLLQEIFENTTNLNTILALIPNGRYSDSIFGERDDGWTQALDVMSTVPEDIHINRSGIYTVVPWAIGSVAQTYDASSVIHESVSFNNMRRRDIINDMRIVYQYRYSRVKRRTQSYSWQRNAGDTDQFCNYLLDPYHLPTRETIQSSVSGAGWQVGGINYSSLPPSGWYECTNPGTSGSFNIGWTINDETAAQVVIGAWWTAYKNWVQPITEYYNISVRSDNSISQYTHLTDEDGANRETEYDSTNWTSVQTTGDSTGDSGTELPVIPTTQAELPDFGGGSSEPTFELEEDSLGDGFYDIIDETARVNDLVTFIAHARNKILAAHRRNYVNFSVPLSAQRDLRDTVRINYDTVDATGKMYKLQHSGNVNTGRAVTSMTLALSRGLGGVDSGVSAPSRPNSDPTYEKAPSPPLLRTYVGGLESSPAYNDNWRGWITNGADVTTWTEKPDDSYTPPGTAPGEDSNKVYISNEDLSWRGSVAADNPNVYSQSFKVETPDIESESTSDPQPGEDGDYTVYNVSIPQDPVEYRA